MPLLRGEGNSSIDWRTVAIVAVPVGLASLGIAGYYFYSKSKKNQDHNLNDETASSNQTKESDLPALPTDPLELAVAHKNKGNKFFKGAKFEKAIECYSEAIAVCPDSATSSDKATFYQNRAAAYENLKDTQRVLDDCSRALELEPKYAKALTRKARALETLGQLSDALEEVTAACIVEQFSNSENLQRADRILKALGQQLAKDAVRSIKPSLPSPSFIRTFLSAFAHDPLTKKEAVMVVKAPHVANGDEVAAKGDDVVAKVDDVVAKVDDVVAKADEGLNGMPEAGAQPNPDADVGATDKAATVVPEAGAGSNADADVTGKLSDEDAECATLKQALAALHAEDYERAFSLAEAAVSELAVADSAAPVVSVAGTRALLLRATIDMLMGRRLRALTDLTRVVECSVPAVGRETRVNALIKRASIVMQDTQDFTAVLADFERALSLWPDCSDVFHHRGQIHLILDKGAAAIEDLTRAVALNPASSIAASQLVYSQYRQAQAQQNAAGMHDALAGFEQLAAKHARCAEVHSLRGQALADMGQFGAAEACFALVSELDPRSGTPLVHRGLLLIQWRQDMDAAVGHIERAMAVDPRCEFALETLATIEVQRGRFARASELFDRAIALTKSEPELAHLLSLREAVKAQSAVCERLKVSIPQVLQASGAPVGVM